MDIKTKIRSIEDFPEKGIIFRDITTLLKDKEGMRDSIDKMQEAIKKLDFDYIVGPESRGFIFGMPIAYNLNKGFIPIRKQGKLPAKVVSKKYALEYGSATIEMHKDAIQPGEKVVIIDDLLATGGTAKAMIEMIESVGGSVVALDFLIELEALKGREMLAGYKVNSIVSY